MRKLITPLILLFSLPLCSQNYSPESYAKAKELVKSLTLEEKIGQMTLVDYYAIRDSMDHIVKYKLGAVLSGGSSSPGENTPYDYRNLYDSIQKLSTQTNSKIPLLYGIDAVHGFSNSRNTTIFPHNIGLGCTHDPDLLKRIGKATATETRATGIHWVYAPCLASPQDERWGRTYEGYSEKPELVSEMGSALIVGLQGEAIKNNDAVLACAKHYIGDGNTAGGVDRGNSRLTEEYLHKRLLPVYDSAIQNGVGSIMASFSAINGEKCHGSSYMLNQLLRDTLGFKGLVVSDWEAIDLLAGDYYSDVVASINAGLDLIMVPNKYQEFIAMAKLAIKNGDISIERIDDAVTNILTQKIELGLFENRFSNKELMSRIRSDEHKALAREAVQKSLVLLENNNALPLSKDLKNIFVAGRHADNLGYQCGGWSLKWNGTSGNHTIGTTMLNAIRNAAPSATVRFVENGQGAEGSDVAIVFIGEEPYAEWFGDDQNLSFDKEDIVALQNAKKSGVPVVCVLLIGRPLILDPILPYCDALVTAWLPGTEGEGVTDILFGVAEPSGKLSYSWPRNMDQIPVNIGDAFYDPLYDFGYGIEGFSSNKIFAMQAAYINDAGTGATVVFNNELKELPIAANFTVRDGSGSTKSITAIRKGESTNSLTITFNERIALGEDVYIFYKGSDLISKTGDRIPELKKVLMYNPQQLEEITSIPGMVQAEWFYSQTNIDVEHCWDDKGGLAVLMEKGEQTSFIVDVSETTTYDAILRVKGLSKATVKVSLDDEELALYNVKLSRSDKWKPYRKKGVTLPQGKHIMKVEVLQGTVSFNWISFDTFRTK